MITRTLRPPPLAFHSPQRSVPRMPRDRPSVHGYGARTDPVPMALSVRAPRPAPGRSAVDGSAADGFFVIAAGNDAMFVHLCKTLDLPIKTDDPRFATNAARCAHHALLKRLIEAVTLEQPAAHWIAKLEAAGLPTARVQDMAEVLKDPQILARAMVLPMDPDAAGNRFTAPGNPIKLSTLPERATRPAAPRLDGNRADILNWLNT